MREILAAAAAVFGTFILWRKKQISGAGMLAAVILSAVGIIYCILRGFSGQWIPVSTVERGETGTGSRQMKFQVKVKDTDSQVILDIPSVPVKQSEAEKSISELLERLDQEILGENESLSEVCYPLRLLSEYPDSAVHVQWQTDAPDYLSWDGELGAEIPEEGAAVSVKGKLSFMNYTELYQRQIRVFPSRSVRDIPERIQAEAKQMNQKNENKVYYLPQTLDENALQWYQVSDSTGLLLICTAFPLLGGFLLIQQQKNREEQKRRQEQLDREYPDLVSRMQMLLSAGLSMRTVLERIGREYRASLETESRRKKGKKRKNKKLIYEEILVSCRELENGVSEGEVYRRLGSRCGTPAFRGLALLLEQNMTKGGQGLLPLLEQEALEAFENRQRRARQAGEKVSVRLLLPMGIMLVIVLAVIMIPAVMSL